MLLIVVFFFSLNNVWSPPSSGLCIFKCSVPIGGSSVTFQVQADPAPSIQWFFNGSLIQTNIMYQTNIAPANNITGSTVYISLLIGSVDLSTQGYYYASFSNIAGALNTSSIFVTPAGKLVLCLVVISLALVFSLPPSLPPSLLPPSLPPPSLPPSFPPSLSPSFPPSLPHSCWKDT